MPPDRVPQRTTLRRNRAQAVAPLFIPVLVIPVMLIRALFIRALFIRALAIPVLATGPVSRARHGPARANLAYRGVLSRRSPASPSRPRQVSAARCRPEGRALMGTVPEAGTEGRARSGLVAGSTPIVRAGPCHRVPGHRVEGAVLQEVRRGPVRRGAQAGAVGLAARWAGPAARLALGLVSGARQRDPAARARSALVPACQDAVPMRRTVSRQGEQPARTGEGQVVRPIVVVPVVAWVARAAGAGRARARGGHAGEPCGRSSRLRSRPATFLPTRPSLRAR